MEQLKKFYPIIFGLIVFCFLLPFSTLSFNGQKVASLSGLQLVIKDNYFANDDLRYNQLGHLTIEQEKAMYPGRSAYGEGIQVFPSGNIIPILALLIVFLCLALSYMKLNFLVKGNKSLLVMLLSISGGITLFLLKNKLDKEITLFEKGRFFIEYEFGYWFALLLFIVSAIILGVIFNQERKMNIVK